MCLEDIKNNIRDEETWIEKEESELRKAQQQAEETALIQQKLRIRQAEQESILENMDLHINLENEW